MFQVLKEKLPKILYKAKLSFRIERVVQSFPETQKLKEFTQPASQKMLKGFYIFISNVCFFKSTMSSGMLYQYTEYTCKHCLVYIFMMQRGSRVRLGASETYGRK